MKTNSLFLLPTLIAVLNLIPAGRVTAQTFTTLHNFTNSDGTTPYAGLVPNTSGNTLYGTAQSGGSSGAGAVFAVRTDGTGFTNIYSFTATSAYPYTNSDGAGPSSRLVLSGNTLYGTARNGGSSGYGTVFAVNTDGTGFTNLHDFTPLSPYDFPNPQTNSDGASPSAGLIISGNTLYGVAGGGGASGAGTVFAVNTDGTGFTNLYSFSATADAGGGFDPVNTNSDGASPNGLILSGDTLYGTARGGGDGGSGTVFALSTNGSGFTNLHSFAQAFVANYLHRNSDGYVPNGLTLSGNTLYGTTWQGNTNGFGTVFAVNANGTGFTNLCFFDFAVGYFPQGGLSLSGHTLYGTASSGGSSGAGTVFAVSTDGKVLTNLYSFTALSGTYPGTNSDGATPYGALLLSGSTLYGTASAGGSAGVGAVFSLALLLPTLTITVSGPYTTLKWPANDPAIFASGFHVQTTTSPLPLSPATIWVNLVTAPSIMNGEFTVILANSYAAQRVYRLWQ
jgi:uncharacterized repeat protein (TIGR03803 family)